MSPGEDVCRRALQGSLTGSGISGCLVCSLQAKAAERAQRLVPLQCCGVSGCLSQPSPRAVLLEFPGFEAVADIHVWRALKT